MQCCLCLARGQSRYFWLAMHKHSSLGPSSTAKHRLQCSANLQLRLNKVSELIHNSTNHKNLAMAKVCVHFQDIIDTVRLLLVKCVASVATVPCLLSLKLLCSTKAPHCRGKRPLSLFQTLNSLCPALHTAITARTTTLTTRKATSQKSPSC